MNYVIIAGALVVLATLLFLYLAIYPNWANKNKIEVVNPRARPTAMLFDHRHGLCKITKGKELSHNSFMLWLLSENGHEYPVKFYKGEIMFYNEFMSLCGEGAPIYITTKAHSINEGGQISEIKKIDTLAELNNQVELTKARAKNQVNDPDEKVEQAVRWLSDLLKAQKQKGDRSVVTS